MAEPLLYFVSCGPGDPGLLTLAGLEAIKASPSILAPDAYTRLFADHLRGKEVTSPFSMDWDTLAGWIESRLVRGSVAFLLPGDFSTFCPFQSFVPRFASRSKVIPGVGTHSAAAAFLKRTLDMPGVAHATVITSPRAYRRDGKEGRGIGDFAEPGRTLVIYMNDLPVEELVRELERGYQPETAIGIFENLYAPDERVTLATLATIGDALGGHDPFGIGSGSPEPTLALVLVGDSLAHDEGPEWWNHRYEKVWKPRGMS